METKAEIIARLKAQYPTLREGSEEVGYTDLSVKDYEAKIEEWADNELAKLTENNNKEIAQQKLTTLGLTTDDLKALGLA